MGIKGLMKLISDEAPDAVREHELVNFNGRRIAIDASMAIYQFLVAVRTSGGGAPATLLTNEEGEVTSHLQGMLTRTIRLMECGIKPVYVFDGKPPTLKSGELARRTAAKQVAEEKVSEAREAGTAEEVDKFSKRTVRMSGKHQEDCKQLLRLMGVPVVEAPCEAEAQCAALAKAGKVYAMASEDMDSLTFATPVLLRRLTSSEARKMPVLEVAYAKVIEGFGLTHEQFVDLCILCGCDYASTIRGIGPKTALQLLKRHGSLERVLATLDKSKHPVPEDFDFEEARRLFVEPEVSDAESLELRWGDCDEEGLAKFLVEQHGFGAERVARHIEKLKKAKGSAAQKRMDSFFKPMARPAEAAAASAPKAGASAAAKPAAGAKRKAGAPPAASKAADKKKRVGR